MHLAVCSLGSSVFSLRSDEKSRFSNFCVWRVGSSWCWCLQLWFWEPLFFLKEWWEISLLEHQANVDSREAISLTSFFNKFHRLEPPFSVRSDQKSPSWSTRRMVIQAELFRWQGVNNNFNSLVFMLKFFIDISTSSTAWCLNRDSLRCCMPELALHEVRCPRPSRAGMQGSGTSKRSLDGKPVLPPLWGVYYACCIKRRSPRWVIVVVVVVVE